jgi:hypothetical protein
MTHTHFSGHRRLRLSLVAFAGAVCNIISANSEAHGWWHRDRVSIGGTPTVTVTAGQAYAFTPTAADSSGQALVFAIANRPPWASFDKRSGRLSGTPSGSDTGTYSNIVIAASDGVATGSLAAFSIQVLAGQTNQAPAPTISGTPPTTDPAGTPYSFQPAASGPNGTTLAFSIQNKPAWASFSIASGMLSGTPTNSQTGSYSNITISVSDGQASSALPAFGITVTAPATTTGTATVTVTPPTQMSDGSPLTNLAGMRVYYGTSPSSLTQQIQLASTTQTTYSLTNLSGGTWYFAATAYTATGVESPKSALASLTVQ